MALSDLMREVKSLSSDELEALYLFVQDQREYRRLTEQEPEETDRHPAPLDMDDLKQIFAELRDGFSEHDLEELDWAMNVEVIKPPAENA